MDEAKGEMIKERKIKGRSKEVREGKNCIPFLGESGGVLWMLLLPDLELGWGCRG